ncbi:nuclear transport factor 2 family protein [Yoonia sp. R2331]|uniref:nuclear transport factor 2 family protein n=1 Tax=Yoonia sp. R2331 TaxID=3237238 RepID=UPI0034E56D54
MSALDTFFAAWSITDAAARHDTIAQACADQVSYSDPRSGGRLQGLDAVATYVGMFSANAPGWTAKVDAADEVNGYMRATVVFGGKGPDGQDMAQHGTYFADRDDSGKITMLAGFVGGGQ